jgi:hypothetical protein
VVILIELHVVLIKIRILHKDKPPLDIGSLYWSLRDSVVRCELFVARVLKFQFAVDHPHKVTLASPHVVELHVHRTSSVTS